MTMRATWCGKPHVSRTNGNLAFGIVHECRMLHEQGLKFIAVSGEMDREQLALLHAEIVDLNRMVSEKRDEEEVIRTV